MLGGRLFRRTSLLCLSNSLFGGRRIYCWKECISWFTWSFYHVGFVYSIRSSTAIAIHQRAAAGSSQDLLAVRSRIICTGCSVQFSTFQTPSQRLRVHRYASLLQIYAFLSVPSPVQSLVTCEGEYVIVGLTNLYTTADTISIRSSIYPTSTTSNLPRGTHPPQSPPLPFYHRTLQLLQYPLFRTSISTFLLTATFSPASSAAKKCGPAST